MHRWLALAVLVSLGCASCTTTAFIDPEYNQEFSRTPNNWTGQEIAGVWVSKLASYKYTVLLRPDGTGIWRGAEQEHSLKWRYAGQGVWVADSTTPSHFDFRYTGSKLLVITATGSTTFALVFVTADSEAAIEEHLQKRG